MRRGNLLNAQLVEAITSLKHTEKFVICDPGLPIPAGANVIDLSLVKGFPGFMQTLEAICEELVVESAVIAEEIKSYSPSLNKKIIEFFNNLPYEYVSHDEFKKSCYGSKTFVITGECTPYANIILVGGVPF